jgi:hypothetical protein
MNAPGFISHENAAVQAVEKVGFVNEYEIIQR